MRLHRTPGSTKDYLSWLEDVDLVTSRQKRYSFTDPLLRLWVRLHCHPGPAEAADEMSRGESCSTTPLGTSSPSAGAGARSLAYAGVEATAGRTQELGNHRD